MLSGYAGDNYQDESVIFTEAMANGHPLQVFTVA